MLSTMLIKPKPILETCVPWKSMVGIILLES